MQKEGGALAPFFMLIEFFKNNDVSNTLNKSLIFLNSSVLLLNELEDIFTIRLANMPQGCNYCKIEGVPYFINTVDQKGGYLILNLELDYLENYADIILNSSFKGRFSGIIKDSKLTGLIREGVEVNKIPMLDYPTYKQFLTVLK